MFKKQRWFSLINNILYYFETKESSASLGQIDLREIDSIEESKKYKDFGFEINTPNRTYVLITESIMEKNWWIEGLRNAKKKLLENKNFIIKEEFVNFLLINYKKD